MKTLTYKTSVKLAKFLGKDVPEPIGKEWWIIPDDKTDPPFIVEGQKPYEGKFPAYTLEDILSRPFCEAFRSEVFRRDNKKFKDLWTPRELAQIMTLHYYDGSMEAVEREILRLMEAK